MKVRDKRKRGVGAYETRTLEKSTAGKNMAEAREIAGMTQEVASRRLGYGAKTQLCQFETGVRFPPMSTLVGMARLYGTTTDYLLGLDDDSDRDPARMLARRIQERVSADIQSLLHEIGEKSAEIARGLLPSSIEGAELARCALELIGAVDRFAARNTGWQDMPVGSTLMSKRDAAWTRAQAYQEKVERAKRLMAARTRRDVGAAESGQIGLLSMLEAAE